MGDLFAIIAPVFACAIIGVVWTRSGRAFETAFVTSLITTIGTPCLVFATLSQASVTPAAFGQIALATILCLICFGLIGALVLRLSNLPFHTFLPALMFPNGGNMGMSLAFFAFGNEGLALAVSVFAIFSVTNFTVGQSIVAGRGQIGQVLRTPLIYAVLAGLVFMLLGIHLPKWAANTVNLVAGMTMPLMLITLGISLGKLRVVALGRGLALSILRLVMGLGVGLAIVWLMGLTGTARSVMIMQASMPVAIFNYLFAQHYGREAEDVASMVVISTILSFATLPLLLLLVLPG